MEEKILKKAAVIVMAAALIACITVPLLPQIRTAAEEWAAAAEEKRTREERKKRDLTELALLEYNNRQPGEDAVQDGRLRFGLPLGVTGNDLELTEDYVTQTVSVTIPYAGEDYLYEYPMTGRSDHLKKITFDSSQKYGTIELIMNQVYELETEFDEDYFYIRFLTPHEVYDKVVVVDAGHGGDDPGITKQGICEKDIDLDIVLKLKEIFENSADRSIGIYYTRTSDTNPARTTRMELAEKAEADLFLSIHNNATKSGMMSSIDGTQVVYDETEERSQALAQICQREMTAILGSSDKGLTAGDQTDVIYGCKKPAALIEVGFMTNQEELADLCSEEYQKKAAQGIYNAVLQAFEEGY